MTGFRIFLRPWHLFFGVSALLAGEGDAILGYWHTPEEESVIEIYSCGEKYCGKIVDLKEKVYGPDDRMAGQVKVDRNNPDKSRRKNPAIGIELMLGFSFNGSQWVGGTIYDPNNGKTYKCKIKLTDDETLEVRGYVGIPAFGRTSIWKRKKD